MKIRRKGLMGLLAAGLLVGLLVPVLASTVMADAPMPSTKTAAVSDCISVRGQNWTKINALDLAIKTGTPKDLVISVSLESSLATTNKIKGTGLSEATASVDVFVKVNGEPVMVCDQFGDRRDFIVVFNRRLVRLSADLTHDITVTGEGVTVEIDDHWIEFFMETKSANSFNFIARDVRDSSDTNFSTIEVWVRAWGDASTSEVDPDDVADYVVALGHASVVVNEVNLKDS